MPTMTGKDGTPIVFFDAQLEISPFTLYRRLVENRSPLLVDVRDGVSGRTLRGAMRRPTADWAPPAPETEVVLFDDDGSAAVEEARRLQEEGFLYVRALFGGLDLYEFSLDPDLLETDTHLERRL